MFRSSLPRRLRRQPKTRSRSRALRAERLEDRHLLAGLVFDSVLGIGDDANGFTIASNAYDIAVDNAGNKYVTGIMYGTQDFDPGSEWADGADIITPRGTYEAFIAKYAPDNSLAWVRQMGSDEVGLAMPNAVIDRGTGVAVDLDGNVYVTGDFAGVGQFGSFTLTSAGRSDAFVTKLDAAGNFLWANRWGDENRDFAEDICLDDEGNVLAVGSSTSPTTNGFLWDGIVMHKYNPTGAPIWSREIHNGNSAAINVGTDSAGNVFVVGEYGGLTDFNPSPSQTHYVSGFGGFVLKLSAAGDFASVSTLLGKTTSADLSWGDLEIDENGNIFGAGSYRGEFDFDPSAQGDFRLPNTGETYAGFIVKYSANGALSWATSLGENSEARGVAVAQQSVYASGSFSNVFAPNGSISIASNGGSDFFVAELSPMGVVQTAIGIGGPATDTSTALVADGSGALHVLGVFNGTVDFNPDPSATHELANPLKGDLYVLKLKTPGFQVTPTTGLVTNEAGTTATFAVSLQAPPTADVLVPIHPSNTSEGAVSTSELTFTPGNWNLPQVVTVTGVDDSIVDGDAGFTIVLGPAVSSDATYNGLDPHDVSATNLDNEVPPTKFYVVDDGSNNRSYEYGTTGTAIENNVLHSGNTAPRGAASTSAGDKVWVVDANRTVYVYNTSGGLLGSWSAGSLASNATVEGIATNGTDVWIVDARSDKVFKYTGAASRTSGSQNAASSFNLNSGNTSPKDIVTDGTHLWVVNDSSINRVFKYTTAGSSVGNWTISGANTTPTGIAIDPANVSDIWIVDSGTDRVYQYTGAASRTSGSQSAAATFPLASGNTNPQGIADPPATVGFDAARPIAELLAVPTVRTKQQSAPHPRPVHSSMIATRTSDRLRLLMSRQVAAEESASRYFDGHAIGDADDAAVIDAALAELENSTWPKIVTSTIATTDRPAGTRGPQSHGTAGTPGCSRGCR
jgi:hypothetical protein